MCYFLDDENIVDVTLIFQLLQSSAAQSQGLSCCPGSEKLEGHKEWEGMQPGQVTQIDQRNILYHKPLCSVIEAGEKAERVGAL